MRPITEPFSVRKRSRVNWWAMFLPLYFAAMLAGLLYWANGYRQNVDAGFAAAMGER